MPSNKPLLIYDGDCGFCRRWIQRWKTLTGDRVLYLPSREAGGMVLNIPLEDFQKAVQLLEPDGRRSSGAQAVFRTLTYAGSTRWLTAYQKIPLFAPISEFFYGIIAGHRPAFSWISGWIWGGIDKPSSYRRSRWLFLRALAVIYGIAFGSFAVQLRGLIGSEGILPAGRFLSQLARYGPAKFWYVPTLAWINSSDTFLLAMCIAGVLASFLIFLNMAPRLCLFSSWVLYLSLVAVGGDFMNFQWDALLLETGFLAIFLAPAGFFPQRRGAVSPPRAIRLLLWWLLFRLMFQSALVKWLSGDTLWHHFTALTVHYQTQPIPNPVAWYVHQAPVWFQKMSCGLMFIIEGLVPFFIFSGRRFRHLAFWLLAGFQILIFITGNYAYFNCLAIALCLLLLDDAALRRRFPAWMDEPILHSETGSAALRVAIGILVLCAAVWYLTIISFGQAFGIHWPAFMAKSAMEISELRSFNSYGLFAVMTPDRPEIILEGSNDKKIWKAYSFKYKPGDPSRRPPQVAPYQPRLDWQMWFAALGDYRQNPWFINLCIRILQGSKPVLDLLAANPFPGPPPVYLRAMVYEYRFTTLAERRQTGHWWFHEIKGPYCPVLSLKER